MKNKLILITGGSSGIGKATAKELVNLGNTVVIQARNTEKLSTVAKEIDSSGKKIHFYTTDLTSLSDVELNADKIIKKHGIPDIIINSAGSGEWLSFNEANNQHYQDTINSPYIATALTCKVFYNKMKKRSSGHFIIINSAACYFSFSGAVGYTAARWALLGFTKSLQADLYGSDFNVSMVALGKVDSPYFKNNPISENKIPKLVNWLVPTLSVNEAAKIIVKTTKRKNKIIIKPNIMRFFVGFNKFFPNLLKWLIRVTG